MADPHNLQRFHSAQAPAYAGVLAELRAGRKRSHWMWFVFPQVRGLGSSPAAINYAIGSLMEARAYLSDPLLGARLRECTALVLATKGKTIEEIFGFPDHLKFRSCMTLFAEAAPGEVFDEALEGCCGGMRDERTLGILRQPEREFAS